ncbi:hypothetical protein M0R19_03975 [Candidatus Pacearchaeota archaeon]|nr:hypothetical protein [Candidatus Pacearchaeota archaeon]
MLLETSYDVEVLNSTYSDMYGASVINDKDQWKLCLRQGDKITVSFLNYKEPLELEIVEVFDLKNFCINSKTYLYKAKDKSNVYFFVDLKSIMDLKEDIKEDIKESKQEDEETYLHWS